MSKHSPGRQRGRLSKPLVGKKSLLLIVAMGLLPSLEAETLTFDASLPTPIPETGYFRLGTARSPAGTEIGTNSRSLLRDGKPWVPVMGEFHYSRYPESEWRDELLKMKAGGIDLVSTYVFWIHHEEIEGQWDWSGQRNLRKFVETARDAGLDVVVRVGPWCHGEVRNGGHPDWLLAKGWKLRSDDPRYLEKVRLLFAQIAEQLKGLLWKEGGPVMAIQIENEFHGQPQHLVTLKNMVREAGLDVPLYTRTGWPTLKEPVAMGELLPLYGAYAEGFWDRDLHSMPGIYPSKYHFSLVRTDAAIASDIFGAYKAEDPPDTARYPFLTCEIGGGMASSYHRRILIEPRDIEALTLVRIGCGGNLPGYYMYHGGTNPDSKRTSLQETQETGMANDLPEKSYDFQAPLGEYGQVRPHYHDLRLYHLFLRDFGAQFAGMTSRIPEKSYTAGLRWAVRSDGSRGVLFVNNYERSRKMAEAPDTQFRIKLASRAIALPSQPATIPKDSVFFWPLNLELGEVKLIYATAQPICQVEEAGKVYTFFAETPGVPSEFAFDSAVTTANARKQVDGLTIVTAKPGTESAVEAGRHVLVLLSAEMARDCYKASWLGAERLFLSKAVVVPDGKALRLLTDAAQNLELRLLPAPEKLIEGHQEIAGKADGIFRRFTISVPISPVPHVLVEQVRAAGPAREVPLGKAKEPVAAAPDEADFAKAAVWRVKLPAGMDPSRDYLLRVRYKGDVLRAYLGGKFVADDFYNGNVFEVGLKRFAPSVYAEELVLKVLPLRKDAPIFLEDRARPDFGGQPAAVSLDSLEVVERREMRVEGTSRR